MKRILSIAGLCVLFCGNVRAADNTPLTIAIMPLENLSGASEYDGLRDGLADGLRTGLEGKKGIRVLERSQLAGVMAEQKLAMTGLVDARTAAGVGKLLGAKFLLTGSFFVFENRIRASLKFVDVASGRIDLDRTIVADDDKDKALEMAGKLAAKVDEALRKQSPAADSAVKPCRIAILPFANNMKQAEYDGIGPFEAEALATALARRADIDVVERAQLQKVVAELKLGASGAVDNATAAQIGKLQGANYLLLGSYSILGGKAQIVAKFVTTETGEVGALPSQQVVGKLDDLFSVTDQLADKIAKALTIEDRKK
ncbi:MAG TPA: CsgG/HfaB family protein [Candidatus Edwardsbacteria bacterium]|nr:CsgG/HfaB family protein [Candidatus Edwardsbacteria bacterium]